MRILLVNPPIYDFSAYDFWLKPYGLLRVAGRLRGTARFSGFDYLISEKRDSFGRGKFPEKIVPKPAVYSDIPRHFRRFGRPREEFRRFLEREQFDVVLVQTVMTYWYLGVQEVLDDLRELLPRAKVVLGGNYATLCPSHARSLGPDLVVEGNNLDPLWTLLGVHPTEGLPLWEGMPSRDVGILRLTEGCPFRCTYCSVPMVSPGFSPRPLEESLRELRHLVSLGLHQVAFYDDALLCQPDRILGPFLEAVQSGGIQASFHTPNGLNARFVSREIARRMVQAGFQTFHLGYESSSRDWQMKTGGKVNPEEVAEAVGNLRHAGGRNITLYVLLGHPRSEGQEIEETLHSAAKVGARIMLSEFAPVPGTPDGDLARRWIDLDEPLHQNKTAFPYRLLGAGRVNQLKALCRKFNSKNGVSNEPGKM